jgi:NAD(P)-dependent dehydrogenase (short-subunit alcohol dehydrogenase family)
MTAKDMNTKPVALVTGGATGIGKETARLLGQQSTRVVISGRRANVGEQTVAELNAEGGDVAFVSADMDSAESITAMFDRIITDYGRLDYAVNNAGLAHETATLGDSDPVQVPADASDQRDGSVPLHAARD